jgi:hypothetical protein
VTGLAIAGFAHEISNLDAAWEPDFDAGRIRRRAVILKFVLPVESRSINMRIILSRLGKVDVAPDNSMLVIECQWLASCDLAGNVRVWNVKTCLQAYEFPRQEYGGSPFAFRRMASGLCRL